MLLDCHHSQPVRRVLLAALPTILLSVLLPPASGAQAPPTDAATSGERPEETAAYRVAAGALAELDQRTGAQAPQELLTRNLSRFFAVYEMPDSRDELGRVLGTVDRMVTQGARLFYAASRAEAEEAGSAVIEPEHVAATITRLLPTRPNGYDQTEFFPAAGTVSIDDADLEAFLDVGLAWQALGSLAEAEAGTPPPSLTDAAARALTDSINSYALLLLRLGGEHARLERAPYLRTDHLRAAGKTIAARAGGDPAPISEPPAAVDGQFFTDVTDQVGPDFRHTTAPWLARFRRYGPIAPTFSGGGVAAADVDGDRWPDLVICGGRGCELWRNRQGRFEDATEGSGVRIDGEARMPLLVDFDNDGDRDLFVTYARDSNRLLLNDGQGRFTDVTREAGLLLEGDISGPAAAFDADGDGWLDLYIGNFGDYLNGSSAWVAADAKNAQPNRLYRNLGTESGGVRFEDVTEAAGVADQGWAQALSHLDHDGDGDQDLYIANDFGRNQLFRNRGDGTFEAAGGSTGSDDPFHGMNVATADLNRDRLPDLFITNIWFWAAAKREVTETNTLLLSERTGDAVRYQPAEEPDLLGPDSGWAWAALFFDVENDGDQDLFVANGFTDYMTFVQYREHPDHPGQLYPIHNARDPNLFFLGDGDVPSELVPDSGVELPGINSRSAALLDFDRDGDLDLLVTTFHERARLLRNDAASRGGWLRVELAGDLEQATNRDAIGAVVTVTDEETALYAWRSLSGGEGYLGMSEPILSFGLGGADRVDVEVVWPGGRRELHEDVAANQHIRITQGESEPRAVDSPGSSEG